jgi:hypothetical protein
MKCDFCEKKAIGYVSMQAAFYCADHQTEAEKIETAMWTECEKAQQETKSNGCDS